MPYGSLTPLGHRLRQVLFSLRPNAIHLDNPSTTSRTASYTTSALTLKPKLRPTTSHAVSNISKFQSAQYGAAAPALEDLDTLLDNGTPPVPIRRISRRHENRRTKVDYLGNELRVIGKRDVAPKEPPMRRRENHFDHRSRHGKRLHADNKKRHAFDHIPPLNDADTLSITRILANYIQHVANDAMRAEWMAAGAFKLPTNDARLLARLNYGIADIKAWAAMVTEPDSVKAANSMHARVVRYGVRSVPLPIISYILRRPYIAPIALRTLLDHLRILFVDLSDSAIKTVSPDAVFVVFNRLTRHARHSWPSALPSIADFLIQFLPKVRPNWDGDMAPSANAITFMLNKAMYLLSEPTSIAPFKDVNFQEKAIIRILSAMAENDPPLQISREGYRAVVRIQLASGKTHSEQQWAALKALSWPPWKENRTDMDSEIGPENGISRARATLLRMKEAGYAPQSWEEIAGVYTGWDVDGTPTIQTRVFLPIWKEGEQSRSDGMDQFHNASLWVARIKTTRTAQEAWACYLAYEDAQHPADQSVLLSILEKLHKEDSRLRKLAVINDDQEQGHDESLRRLFPGDTKEVEPLPPSTHLYTYTRTSPPSAHDFYLRLQDHNVDMRDHCLAYLISNASSFKEGVAYLKTAISRYPAVTGLVIFDPRADLDSVPAALFHAHIKFLSRFSNADATKYFSKRTSQALGIHSAQLVGTQFNFQHSLIQAIWLLKERRPDFLPAWNAVLDALARNESYDTMHLTESSTASPIQPPDLDLNTITAYRLTQQVLRLLQGQNMVPDSYGFIALCRSTENVGIACWGIYARDHESNQTAHSTLDTAKQPSAKAALEAKEFIAQERPCGRVEQYFKLLVGEESFTKSDKAASSPLEDTPDLDDFSPIPRLLAVPEPLLLHAYIRALGWHASHASIIRALKWMVRHQEELAEISDRARNGPKIMRRTIIATRVFLERSWLSANSLLDYDYAARDAFARAELEDRPEVLKRLEAPAPEVQIEEARRLVESVSVWGGWATDEEVEAYCGHERFREFG
jgi:hypothetical protein